uniref:Uncharacterized protein n=1 Tax=Anguilla anguilla TaxID=7936 RepID=A0A0E9R646_ANGAN
MSTAEEKDTAQGDCVDAKPDNSKGLQGAHAGSQPVQVDAKPQSHSFRYSLDYPSIGQCIIINNKNFDSSTGMNARKWHGRRRWEHDESFREAGIQSESLQ